MENTSTHSTPSKTGTAARDSSRAEGKTVNDVFEDIKIDVNAVKQADFTAFLRLFLSRCLIGEERTRFENLQSRIETLQKNRVDKAELRRTGENNEEDTILKHVSDPTQEERTSVDKRDKLLEGFLEKALKAILPVANKSSVRGKLKEFALLVKNNTPERGRYHAYADMYNSALDELAKVDVPSLREADLLALRLCRADPQPISSTFTDPEGREEEAATVSAAEGKETRAPSDPTDKTLRIPDFVRTSTSAALDTHKDGDFANIPSKSFEWPQVLSVEEMKIAKRGITAKAEEVLDDSYLFDETGSLHDPQLTWVKPVTPEDMVDSRSNSQTGSRSKRIRSESSANVESDSKKYRVSESGASKVPPADSPAKRNVEARVQVAGYAMEMMSYSAGVVQVINTLIVDDHLYIWYYDRQGATSSHGINIIANFPLFLALLFAFQRFTVDDWGVVPFLNPTLLNSLKIDGRSNWPTKNIALPQGLEMCKPLDPKEGPMHVSPNKYLSPRPHCLSGRTTSVVEANLPSSKKRLALKVYSPEVQRIREDDCLHVAHALADECESDKVMLKHLPQLYLSGDLPAGNTLRARSILGIPIDSHRTLRIVVMNELKPLTSLSNAQSIVKAWFDIVTVHAWLWGHGIEHGDPSLWNMMVDPASQCGVLTDFDLSVMTWLHRVPGTDRTGTIPFMALELLSEDYWDGKTMRYYFHELEALLWAIIAVFIAHDGRKFQSRGSPIQGWFTSDYVLCRQRKTDFLLRYARTPRLVQACFRPYLVLMGRFCAMMLSQQQKYEDELFLYRTSNTTMTSPVSRSMDMWDAFNVITTLSQNENHTNTPLIETLKSRKPRFDILKSDLENMRSITGTLFQSRSK